SLNGVVFFLFVHFEYYAFHKVILSFWDIFPFDIPRTLSLSNEIVDKKQIFPLTKERPAGKISSRKCSLK
ncbi:hypothetical protein ACWOEH_07990, partial [Enterococcus nangangensis]